MASSSGSRMQHEIRRVPVPNHPTAVLASAPGPAVVSEPVAGLPAHASSQGPHRSTGPIPIVATLPQPSFQYPSQSQTHLHSHQQQQQQQQGRGPTITLSPQMEEDLKAAVLGTMASTQPLPSQQASTASAKEVRVDKWLRYTSICLCAALVVAEAVLAIVMYPSSDVVYGIPWGTLLGCWDLWRIIRSRRKRDGEPPSTWQAIGEGIFMTVTIALTVIVVASLTNSGGSDDTRTRCWVLAFVFLVLAILHLALFIRTCADKWSRPNRQLMELPLYHDPKQQQLPQPPQFIVQYVHECPHCGNQLGPQPGEDLNADLASKGDAQPQGVAPAYLRS